jgi:hypothetical protein
MGRTEHPKNSVQCDSWQDMTIICDINVIIINDELKVTILPLAKLQFEIETHW